MNKIIHYLGLDVHKDSIAVSIAPANSTEVRRYGSINGSLDAVDKLIINFRSRADDFLAGILQAKDKEINGKFDGPAREPTGFYGARSTPDSFGAPPPSPPPAKAILVR